MNESVAELMTEARIAHGAREIRRLYFEEKSRRIGATYKKSSRHDSIEYFRAAAEICLQEEISPEAFIKAAFDNCTMKEGPFPNALGGGAARSWVRSFKRDRAAIQQGMAEIAPNLTQPPTSSITDTAHANDADNLPAVIELKQALGHASYLLKNSRGIADPTSADAQKAYEDYCLPFHPVARVVLGWPSREVWEICGRDVRALFLSNPEWVVALKHIKYPADQLLAWMELQH